MKYYAVDIQINVNSDSPEEARSMVEAALYVERRPVVATIYDPSDTNDPGLSVTLSPPGTKEADLGEPADA